jgi:hypothetical protein
MAQLVGPHPYQVALDKLFSKLDCSGDDTTHELVYRNDVEGLRKWISPDPKKLKTGQSVEDVVRSRINKFITEKHLHPLHICAMLDRTKMAKMLVDTDVCELDPEDWCKYTPLHHAAVGGFQGMLRYLIGEGADLLRLNDRGGNYWKILHIIHSKIDPSSQVCHYKNSKGEIVQGNGHDFARLTGGAVFLDSESTMSVEEAVSQWNFSLTTNSILSPQVLGMLRKVYDVYLTKPPMLYLEKREGIGLNVCAGEDIEAGAMITEYLGEDESSSLFEMGTPLTKTYSFTPFDAEKKRGMAALMRDSFPNCKSFNVPKLHGLVKRVVFLATTRILKGSTVSYNCSILDPVKFEPHQELCEKEMITFFQPFTLQAPEIGRAHV